MFAAVFVDKVDLKIPAAMTIDTLKTLIALKQAEMPFDVRERECKLPINREKIITIPGVRRCGKSSLMMIAINDLLHSGVAKENILWLGFDDERLRRMSTDELDLIIQAYMQMYPEIAIKDVHMFFDEIQLVPDWEYFVLRLYKSYCKNIYICGSNASMLSTELKSALRGWPLEYPTYPLSFKEYCSFTGVDTSSYLEQDLAKVKNAFLAYNSNSSFPEIVLTSVPSEQVKLVQGYLDTMILRDLVEHYSVSNVAAVRYFIKRIMASLTKPTSILSIYNDIKSQGIRLTKDEVYKWADYVCSIFLFLRIQRFDPSLSAVQRSLCKYYCIDAGLRSYILLPTSEDNGKLLENNVFLHLNRNLAPNEKIYYYSDRNECDFVLQRGEQIGQLIQVCWDISSQETLDREIAGLLEASKATKCDNLLIVTAYDERTLQASGHTIEVVPAWKWMLS